jgi:hypothetical protein
LWPTISFVANFLHFAKEKYFIAILKKKMLKKELIFLSFVKLAYNMKGCLIFSSLIF